jgi:cytosine/adenosine deaminase-related metal-dependent hydrolase
MNNVALRRGTVLLLIGAMTPMSALIWGSSQAMAQQATYDIVLIGGTVVDPETNLQAVRNVAISGGKIAMVSTTPLRGRTTVNAKGLVVAPGFIDIHVHGQSIPTDWLSAFDGVTTAVETEAGRYPTSLGYAAGSVGGRPLNYGFGTAWAAARGEVAAGLLQDGTLVNMFLALGKSTAAAVSGRYRSDRAALTQALTESGLREGGLGIGMPVGYLTRSNKDEYINLGHLARTFNRPLFSHLRHKLISANPNAPEGMDSQTAIEAFQEGIEVSARSNGVNVLQHINSTATQALDSVIPMIQRAMAQGIPVVPEVYPWGAGSTTVKADFLEPTMLQLLKIEPSAVRPVNDPNKRFSSVEEFAAWRESAPGDTTVIIHYLDETEAKDRRLLDQAVLMPNIIFASDAMPIVSSPKVAQQLGGSVFPKSRFLASSSWDVSTQSLPLGIGTTHPRSAAVYSKIFANYVIGGADSIARKKQGLDPTLTSTGLRKLTLMQAVRQSTLLPANLLGAGTPAARNKGRIQVGKDADVVVFDLASFTPRADYPAEKNLLTSRGVKHLLVNGQFVIRDAKLDPSARPGRPLRAPVADSVKPLEVQTWRLVDANGNELITADATETTRLQASGWTSQPTSFSLLNKKALSQDLRTSNVYRLVNPKTGDRIYATREDRRDTAIANGYQLEGIAGTLAVGLTLGTWPILAFYQPSTGKHRYTASRSERIALTQNTTQPWLFQEVIGWTDTPPNP